MRRCNRLPVRWLFTDERIGDRLWTSLERLPRGSGVVFRHYRTPNRAALLEQVDALAVRKGLLLVAADPPTGWTGPRHANRGDRRPGALTASAHDAAELVRAARLGAALAFLSPVFPTRSHAAAAALGPLRFGRMARRSPLPVAALGGMDEHRFRRLKPLGAAGWAAIDAWIPEQDENGPGRKLPGWKPIRS
ncbi:hypothetical protein B5C34_04235 [Pacificimonas flava]|uniref:Thiamine phosphate synthase/TenI domain-containing protein n=2 Tax=Pacificimonas TaxID=1960290 RepID=A0A219B3M6_9SPHN|nr:MULTISPECIES: thiamine phosphate synthase [Pacificimonas]MBZ6377572.1 thiamine phosphate synthase [Pacificimonas aurantium]OWV32736.1 hypothetical protein B5C34_04235 [Pacificimonas flava]